MEPLVGIAACFGFVAGALTHRVFTTSVRRVKTAAHLPAEWIEKKRTITGIVAAVGDVRFNPFLGST